MANQPKKYKKFVATAATATLVASAIVPVASAASFSDVATSTHAEAINALADQGIIKGYADGTFKPNTEINRGQTVKLLGRWLETQGYEIPADWNSVPRFNDLPLTADEELVKYAALVKDAGVFNGSNGKLNYNDPMQRQQMALVLVRAINTVLEVDLIAESKEAGFTTAINDLNKAYADENREAIVALEYAGITVVNDFRPTDSITRGQFASFLYRAIQNEEGTFDLKIESVTALNDANSFFNIQFSKRVANLEPADIVIEDAKTKERYGVKSVTLSADGLNATVELYSHDDATKNNPVLKYLTDYNVSVAIGNELLKTVFNRPESVEVLVEKVNWDDRKITVSGETAGTLEVLENVEIDFEEIKGRTVQIWFNKDREVLQVVYKENEDVIYSAIQLDKKDEIKTLHDGQKYKISDRKFKFYLNDEVADYEDYREDEIERIGLNKDPELSFAKVVLGSNGEVEYIAAYTFEDYAVVESVDEDAEEIVGVHGTGSISDAADYLIVKDGKQIAYTDVKKGDVVLFNSDAYGEDGFAVVLNNTVTGTIEDVFEDTLVVDGEEYDYIRDQYYLGEFGNAKYLNEDGEFEVLSKGDDDLEDMVGEEVTLYLDARGDLLFIGNEVTASVEDVAILTDDIDTDYSFGKWSVQLETLDAEGKETLSRVQLSSLSKITVNGVEYDIDDKNNRDADEYKPEVVNGKLVLTPGDTSKYDVVEISLEDDFKAGSLVSFGYDSRDNLKELKLFTDDGGEEGVSALSKALEHDDNYAITADGAKRLKANTVVFDAKRAVNKGYDAKDISVTTWGEYKGSDITKATVLYDDDNEVVALVIEESPVNDAIYEEAVITNVSRNTDGELVRIQAYVNGKKQTFDADKITGSAARNLAKGDVAVLEFDKSNTELVKEVIVNNSRFIYGQTIKSVDIGKREVVVGNTTYTLVSDGLVLDGKDNSNITVEALSDLRGETNVTIVLDEESGKFVKFFVIEPKDENTGGNEPAPAPQIEKVEFEDTDKNEGKIAGDVVVTATNAATIKAELNGVELPGSNGTFTIAEGTDLGEGKLVITVENSEGVKAVKTVDLTELDFVDQDGEPGEPGEPSEGTAVADLVASGALEIKDNQLTDKLQNVIIDSTKLPAELQDKTLVLVIDGTEVAEFKANRFKATQLEVNAIEFTKAQIEAGEVVAK